MYLHIKINQNIIYIYIYSSIKKYFYLKEILFNFFISEKKKKGNYCIYCA